MKILMVSIFAPHFFNWTDQLRDTDYEIHWIDVYDSNTKVKKIDFVNQIIGWRYKIEYPGRYWIKQNLPFLYNFINKYNERDLSSFVKKKIKEIRPDVVQSFVLQSGAYPLLEIMKEFPDIKWIFSAWGNDLYFRQQNEKDLHNIQKTLPRIDYMFADCKRDFGVALNHGFKGKFLGAFPGGGGYDLEKWNKHFMPFHLRNIITIKGYQGKLGRGIKILEALLPLQERLKNYNIIVFGGNKIIEEFIENSGLSKWSNFSNLGHLPHDNVLALMGASRIYIGNSISDGMPNTLLEAVVMGAYPIQSNPGGATSELIQHGRGGLLIKNPEDSEEIKDLLIRAFENPDKIKKEIEYNLVHVRPKLNRDLIKSHVLKKYRLIEFELNNK